MKNKRIYTLFCIIIVCFLTNVPVARGYSLRQFSSRNGLSNSACNLFARIVTGLCGSVRATD